MLLSDPNGPEIDLEPGAYRVKGRKEPILARGWYWGLLSIALVFGVAFLSRWIASLFNG